MCVCSVSFDYDLRLPLSVCVPVVAHNHQFEFAFIHRVIEPVSKMSKMLSFAGGNGGRQARASPAPTEDATGVDPNQFLQEMADADRHAEEDRGARVRTPPARNNNSSPPAPLHPQRRGGVTRGSGTQVDGIIESLVSYVNGCRRKD